MKVYLSLLTSVEDRLQPSLSSLTMGDRNVANKGAMNNKCNGQERKESANGGDNLNDGYSSDDNEILSSLVATINQKRAALGLWTLSL